MIDDRSSDVPEVHQDSKQAFRGQLCAFSRTGKARESEKRDCRQIWCRTANATESPGSILGRDRNRGSVDSTGAPWTTGLSRGSEQQVPPLGLKPSVGMTICTEGQVKTVEAQSLIAHAHH